jgi:type II secretory pathway component PulC
MWLKNKSMKIIFLITFLLITNLAFSQELAKFSVKTAEERIDAPVSVSLDGLNYNTDKGNLALIRNYSTGEKLVASQIEPGHSARLWFILKGVSAKSTERTFVLKT